MGRALPAFGGEATGAAVVTTVLSVLLGAVAVFATAYVAYGRLLRDRFDLDDERETPAHARRDGTEFVPARKAVLFGHHFSSIAGGAVIIGPVTAALAWGWVPAVAWIVVGTVVFGGLNDFATLVASVRHGGRSIGHLFGRYVDRRGKRVLLSVAVAANLLVVGVLSLVTAVIFDAFPSAATASVLYVLLAVLFGVYRNRLSLPFVPGTVAFVAAVFGSVLVGIEHPLVLVPDGGAVTLPTVVNPNVSAWLVCVLLYALVASVLPVDALLQPRDYLSSFLLYAGLFGALAGIVVGTLFGTAAEPLTVGIEAYTGFTSDAFGGMGPLVPMLFPTIFCGAVCGLHSMVCCGTTPKQLDSETDAHAVGYGTTIAEGVLAVLAVGLVAVVPEIPAGSGLELALPTFATGGGIVLGALGVPRGAGAAFMALMLSAFSLTTVDTSIRLGRYFVGEIVDESTSGTQRALSRPTVNASLQVGAAYLLVASGGWTTVWPLFGGAVQLFAGLTMLTLSAWIARSTGFDHRWTLAGAGAVLAVSASALIYTAVSNVRAKLLNGTWVADAGALAVASVGVQVLAVVLLVGLAAVVVLWTVRSPDGVRARESLDAADD
ncbi:carbon starvation CstA family protein [Halostella pelagica]|uniref:carbon starvation CstA family protein n=1 Tax=Halostella pelagica TaxID=2583824 RepID=UPI001F208C62|nr:carbon starvation protein A [Halostella pelagica]